MFLKKRLDLSNNPGIFNFALHAEDIIFSPQAGDVENSLYNKLGYDYSNYQRWQIFSEYQIKMDDFSKENIDNLIELARQYLEELYASDNNYFNKLLDKLENVHDKNELTLYTGN